MKRSFSISKAISFGFNITKKNFVFLVGVLLIVFVANAIPEALTVGREGRGLLGIVGWVIQIIITMGIINISLRLHDKKKTSYSDFLSKAHLFASYFLASVLYMLIVVAGLILLIIPGIYWGIKYQYYTYFIVDQGMGPIQALKASGKITNHVKWKLFFLKIVLALVNLLGLLALVVGLLVTIPTTFIAEAYVFRKLSSK